jgi:Transposase DDE domain
MSKQLPSFEKFCEHFKGVHKTIVRNFFMLIQATLKSRTCCINKSKSAFYEIKNNQTVQIESVYKQMLRFFEMKTEDLLRLSQCALSFCLEWFGNSKQGNYLVMDRTNWKQGKVHINILYLGILLPNKKFIPIIWEILPEATKRGNSNTAQRTGLMNNFLGFYKKKEGQKLILLTDREFVGEKWWLFLSEKGIDFVARLRKQDAWKKISENTGLSIPDIDKKINCCEKKQATFFVPLKIENQPYFYLSATLKPQKSQSQTFFFLSSLENKKEILEAYKLRWGIEVFFKNIKTNGFDLEKQRFTNRNKIQLLLLIVAFCYLLCLSFAQSKHLFPSFASFRQPPKVSDFRFALDHISAFFLISFSAFLEFISTFLHSICNL